MLTLSKGKVKESGMQLIKPYQAYFNKKNFLNISQ